MLTIITILKIYDKPYKYWNNDCYKKNYKILLTFEYDLCIIIYNNIERR